MPANLEQIKQYTRELELGFYIGADEKRILIPYYGVNAFDRLDIDIAVHEDGAFVQLTAILVFGIKPEDALNWQPMLEEMDELNRTLRSIKIAADADRRTIRAYCDASIIDSTLTAMQFRNLLDTFTWNAFFAKAKLLAAMTVCSPDIAPSEVPHGAEFSI
jgi:hypothetical protein